MTFKATYDNVVVKLIEEENTTTGGIVLAGNQEKTHSKGVVAYVGEGRTTKEGKVIPLIVNVGDTVLFGLGSGINIFIDGTGYVVVKEDNIFATEL